MTMEFTEAFRGYDRPQVDEVVADLRSYLAEVESANESVRREIATLEEEVALFRAQNKGLRAKVDELPDRPSFAKLGTQFEEVLKLGEEKAARLVAEARADAEAVRRNAQAKTDETLREAQTQAQQVIAEAEERVGRMRARAEDVAARLTAQANERLVEATERAAAAVREAAELTAQAENDIRAAESQLQRELDAERLELRQLADRLEREREGVEEMLRERAAQFEVDQARRQQGAAELTGRLIAEASQKADEMNANSRAVDAESLALAAATHVRVDELLTEARRIAGGLLDQAQSRANSVGEHTRRHADGIIERSVARLKSAREEHDAIQAFLAAVSQSRDAEQLLTRLDAELNESSS